MIESKRMPEEWRRGLLVQIFKNKDYEQSCSSWSGARLISHFMKLWERARLRRRESRIRGSVCSSMASCCERALWMWCCYRKHAAERGTVILYIKCCLQISENKVKNLNFKINFCIISFVSVNNPPLTNWDGLNCGVWPLCLYQKEKKEECLLLTLTQ